eukprot:s6427_g3.t1
MLMTEVGCTYRSVHPVPFCPTRQCRIDDLSGRIETQSEPRVKKTSGVELLKEIHHSLPPAGLSVARRMLEGHWGVDDTSPTTLSAESNRRPMPLSQRRRCKGTIISDGVAESLADALRRIAIHSPGGGIAGSFGRTSSRA